VTTFQAEIAIRRQAVAAFRTSEFKLSATPLTKFGAVGKLDLALWAFHGCPPLGNVEEGGLLKSLSPEETPHDGMNNN